MSTPTLFTLKRFSKVVTASFALFILSVSVCNAQEPHSLTLSEAYDLALKQSELLQRRTEAIKEAKARYDEAIAALYPNVHALASQRFRNTAQLGGSPSTGDINNDSGSYRTGSKHPVETSIFVRQPIFTGFREHYLAAASKGEMIAIGYDQTRDRQLLYEDVADVFNQILYYTDDLKILRKTEDVFKRRIEELRQFIKLGKSRDSEIDAAQSDVADLGATEARVTGLLGASKELLAFLIGKEASTFKLEGAPSLEVIPTLEDSLTRARERADIKANKARVDSAGKEIVAAERERWPVISLDGNYYPYEDPDSDRQWDVVFRFDLPLYEGGAIDARVEQYRAKARAAALLTQENSRAAEREVRVAYNNVTAAKAELTKLESLVETTRKNYEAQRRDYELGVVTNLEVLTAIRSIQEAERRRLEAQTILRNNIVKLRVASGEI
ncbi:MAG: TolC family protein [Deltaproteobacteria bacterium]|nr:TolC family protein [Deltaproteobacteria bacterium]